MGPIQVETTIETGRQVHNAAGWTLSVWAEPGDQEPRMRDVDVATRLGFAEPRMVRKLIKRIWPENKVVYVRSTVERTSMPQGGTRETTVQEHWLTEAQILKLCARSTTPVAEAILDEMIAVYMAVRRGLLASTSALTAADVARMIDERLLRQRGAPTLAARAVPASQLHESISEVTALATARWYFAELRGAIRGGRAHVGMFDNRIAQPLTPFGWAVDAQGRIHTRGEVVAHLDAAYGNLWLAADADRVFVRQPRPPVPSQVPELPRIDACLYRLGWLSADNITKPRGVPSYRVRGDLDRRGGSYCVVRWASVRGLLL